MVTVETSNDAHVDEGVQQNNDPLEKQSEKLMKNTIKPRVKNPLGGKNPQLSVKGKKVSKPVSGSRKEKGVAIGGIIKSRDRAKKGVNDFQLGKENVPSSSNMSDIKENSHPDEQAVLAYMKTMYKTHGENLLNKFKSFGPIRIALGHIDNNDTHRGEGLQPSLVTEKNLNKSNGNQSPSTSMTSNSVKQIDNGDKSPMDASEEVVPHKSNLSL